jgi:cAMP-binding proteins - catabolite gene activator and regulatory subunit of cAMP-dependent protein kinases
MRRRFTEDWQRLVFAINELDAGAKVAGWGLAQFADWDTGANACPSIGKLAAMLGMTRESTSRAIKRLAGRGLIEQTGTGHNNTRVYRLHIPPGHDADITASRDADITAQEGQAVTSTRQAVTPRPASRDAGVTQPHQTSSDRRTDDEDDDARAAASADAAAARASGERAPDPATVQASRQIAEALTRGPDAPKVWQGREIDTRQLHAVVGGLLQCGWLVDELEDYALTVGTPRRSPTRLLAAHVAQLADEDLERWRATAVRAPVERRARRALGSQARVADVLNRLRQSYDWPDLDGIDLEARLFDAGGRPARSKHARAAFGWLTDAEERGFAPLALARLWQGKGPRSTCDPCALLDERDHSAGFVRELGPEQVVSTCEMHDESEFAEVAVLLGWSKSTHPREEEA